MQIYPAIDIKRGKTTYLFEGKPGDPVAIAERFLADGATWLHVVDVDRAFDTGRDNTTQIREIARLPGASIQLGGLLRTMEQVRHGLDVGVARVVLPAVVLLDRALLATLLKAAGMRHLAVAIEVRKSKPILRGSSQALRESAAELVTYARAAGVETIVYRDLDRDGRLTGFDLSGAATLVPLGGNTIIAGGGSSIADLRSARSAGLDGAIVGRALYEGRFTLSEALACSR